MLCFDRNQVTGRQEEEKVESSSQIRRRPFLSTRTLKLTSSPTDRSASFKYVISCAEWIVCKRSTALSSSMSAAMTSFVPSSNLLFFSSSCATSSCRRLTIHLLEKCI